MAWRRWLPGAVLVVVGLSLLALPRVADNYVLYVMTRLFVYVLVALGLNLLTGYAGQVSLGHAAFFAIGAYTAAVLADAGSGRRCSACSRRPSSRRSSDTCWGCRACA